MFNTVERTAWLLGPSSSVPIMREQEQDQTNQIRTRHTMPPLPYCPGKADAFHFFPMLLKQSTTSGNDSSPSGAARQSKKSLALSISALPFAFGFDEDSGKRTTTTPRLRRKSHGLAFGRPSFSSPCCCGFSSTTRAPCRGFFSLFSFSCWSFSPFFHFLGFSSTSLASPSFH